MTAVSVIAKADGPFLTSGTFNAIINAADAGASGGAGYVQLDNSQNTNTTTSFVSKADSSFDGPLSVSTDGVMLYLEQNAGATGTFTVEKYEIGGSIEGTVVVNVGDLPANGAPKWVFFKFAAPYVTNNGFYHNIRVKSSVNATVKVYRSATAGAWAFATRKTSVPAVPVSGDTAYIVGELTGAGTGTDRYVTPGVETGITVTVGQRGFHSAPPPTVSSVSANSGPAGGGTAVTITGTGFASVSGVTFGGVAATGVVTVGPTSVTCTTPAHAAGAVNVVVTNGDAQIGTGTNAFTYLDPIPKTRGFFALAQ